MMRLSVVLPADDGVQAHVFHAAEDVVLDIGGGGLQLAEWQYNNIPLPKSGPAARLRQGMGKPCAGHASWVRNGAGPGGSGLLPLA